MARGDFKLFDQFCGDLGLGLHDLDTHTLTIGIITTAVTPAATQADPKWGTYSANQVSTDDSQYPAPIDLTGVTYTNSSNIATLDSSDVALTQNSSAFTNAGWAILYNNSHSSDLAIGFLDMGGPVDLTAGPVTIAWNSSGIAKVTVTT